MRRNGWSCGGVLRARELSHSSEFSGAVRVGARMRARVIRTRERGRGRPPAPGFALCGTAQATIVPDESQPAHKKQKMDSGRKPRAMHVCSVRCRRRAKVLPSFRRTRACELQVCRTASLSTDGRTAESRRVRRTAVFGPAVRVDAVVWMVFALRCCIVGYLPFARARCVPMLEGNTLRVDVADRPKRRCALAAPLDSRRKDSTRSPQERGLAKRNEGQPATDTP
jgi:hypothetical protein